MQFCRFLLGVSALAIATVSVAGPVLATFDNFNAVGGDVPITSPYLGLNWTNFTAYTATPGFDGFNKGVVSAANAAYSGGETSSGNGVSPIAGSITSSKLFNFGTAYLGSGYYDDLTLTVAGLRGGSLLFSQSLTLDTTGAKLFNFNFTNIDQLEFVASVNALTTDPFACGRFDCTQFTLDNVALTVLDVVTPPTGVPEPNSLALVLVAGLGAFGVRNRIRRRHSPY